jgi:hypothetical protein
MTQAYQRSYVLRGFKVLSSLFFTRMATRAEKARKERSEKRTQFDSRVCYSGIDMRSEGKKEDGARIDRMSIRAPSSFLDFLDSRSCADFVMPSSR